MVHLFVALVRVAEKYNRPDNRADDGPPPFLERFRKIDDHLGHVRQVGAESSKQALKLRNNEYQQYGGNDKCYNDDSRWVEQRRFDLALDCLDFFLIGGDLIQNAVQDTRLFTRLHQVAVQGIKVKRKLAKRLVQLGTRLHVLFDGQDDFLHGWVFMSFADDIEGLGDGNARRQHGSELAGEY